MNGRSSITDTVNRTGPAQSKVSTSVAKLRDRRWVTTSPDPADGRTTLAAATDEIKLQGYRRRGRRARDALDAVLAHVDPDRSGDASARLPQGRGLPRPGYPSRQDRTRPHP